MTCHRSFLRRGVAFHRRLHHAFLTRGDVFTDDVITTWINYKRRNEITPLTLRPHPYEFFLYYDS